MFDWGVPPHGGFAIGLERLTCQVLNLTNVRQAVLYPQIGPRRKWEPVRYGNANSTYLDYFLGANSIPAHVVFRAQVL
jgi:hypothetical protein